MKDSDRSRMSGHKRPVINDRFSAAKLMSDGCTRVWRKNRLSLQHWERLHRARP
jgi:hypothetical protein